MWLSRAVYDPQGYREEETYFDYLRAAFDDPLPIHDYAPIHPLMVHGAAAANRARQHRVLDAIEHYQAEEHARGQRLRAEFLQGKQTPPQKPKPGQPGYKPPALNVPGSQWYTGYNPPPGYPGHDPSLPFDQPTRETAPKPSIPPQKFEE